MKFLSPGLFAALLAAFLLTWAGCDKEDENDPSALGGDTNLELTQVGNEFPVSISTDVFIPAFQNLKDSIVIIRNDGGIVTFRGIMTFDTAFTSAVAGELGIAGLPGEVKHNIVDTYVKLYSATLDTTDKNAMRVTADVKFRITSEGIQGFAYSKGDLSKPFTIVKYGSNVGDTYEMTTDEGVKITRRVAYKSTTDDYPVGFWMIKVLKVEETKEDPYVEKVTFVANHKFGMVGAMLKTKAGKEIKVGIFPPNM